MASFVEADSLTSTDREELHTPFNESLACMTTIEEFSPQLSGRAGTRARLCDIAEELVVLPAQICEDGNVPAKDTPQKKLMHTILTSS